MPSCKDHRAIAFDRSFQPILIDDVKFTGSLYKFAKRIQPASVQPVFQAVSNLFFTHAVTTLRVWR
jgi:hypothetical protein